MRIALASDIHLEFGELPLVNDQDARVLILSGDIFIAETLHKHPEPVDIALKLGEAQQRAQDYRNFLKCASQEFPDVVIIAGNHEFYNGKWRGSIQHLRDECSKFPNVHFLENNHIQLDGVTFVGGTLWTDLNRRDPVTAFSVKSMMNDFRLIRDEERGYQALAPARTVERHLSTVNYIKEVVDADPAGKFVVVGHHAPSFLSVHEMYKDQRIMNGAYASDLTEFILNRPQIVLWTHGHTHFPFDYMIGSTRVVCNPRGYVKHERGTQAEDPYFPQIIDI